MPQKMPGGWWEATPEEARDHFASHPDARIIDVREPAEFAAGHVEGAVLHPLDDVLDNPEGIPGVGRDEDVWLYCRSGRRSGVAAADLAKKGYTRVHNFQGVMQWPFGLVR